MTIKSNTTKFSNVDLFSFMGAVVAKHVKYYQSDFDIDKEILLETAAEEQQVFIWLCRTSGTWLLRERNVFIRETREHNTSRFYAEQTDDKILAFAIEITDYSEDSIMGNIYFLDYSEYYKCVCEQSLKPETVLLQYEKGCRTKRADEIFNFYPDKIFGKLQSYSYQVSSEDELSDLIRKKRKERQSFTEGNIDTFISLL